MGCGGPEGDSPRAEGRGVRTGTWRTDTGLQAAGMGRARGRTAVDVCPQASLRYPARWRMTGTQGRRDDTKNSAMPRMMLLLLLAVPLAGCRRVSFDDSVLSKPDVRYRVGELPGHWKRVWLEDNDVAFSEPGTGRAVSVNATCEGHDDPPLPVLTRHLLMGFTERQELSQRLIPLAGREALRSRYLAKLDGVPVQLELVVLKKDTCVFDFTYVAPPEAAEERLADFEGLLAGFEMERLR